MNRLCIAIAIASSVLGAGVARGDDPTQTEKADDLFKQGTAMMGASEFDAACKMFARSLELDWAVATAVNLAKCYEKLGRVASAWEQYIQVRDRYKGNDRRVTDLVTKGVTAMQKRLPRLEIHVARETVVIRVDGRAWIANTPSVIDPGLHAIEVTAPGMRTWSGQATTEESKTATVTVPELEAEPPPVESPPKVVPPKVEPPKVEPPKVAPRPVTPSEPPPARNTLRLVSYGSVGLGALALVVGGVSGLRARSAGHDATEAGCDDNLANCPDARSLELAHTAYDRGSLATGTFVAGGLLVAGGVVLYVLSGDKPPADRTAWRMTPSLTAVTLGRAF